MILNNLILWLGRQEMRDLVFFIYTVYKKCTKYKRLKIYTKYAHKSRMCAYNTRRK